MSSPSDRCARCASTVVRIPSPVWRQDHQRAVVGLAAGRIQGELGLWTQPRPAAGVRGLNRSTLDVEALFEAVFAQMLDDSHQPYLAPDPYHTQTDMISG